MHSWRVIVAALVIGCGLVASAGAAEFQSEFAKTPDRVWIGPEYWANPMEDWQVKGGRIECIKPGGGRNVHLLTHQLGAKNAAFTMSVRLGTVGGKAGAAGFIVGVRDDINDYRGNVFWGQGIEAYVTSGGEMVIGKKKGSAAGDLNMTDVTLTLVGKPAGDQYELTLTATSKDNDKLNRLTATVAADAVIGNVALMQSPKGASGRGRGGRKPAGGNATFWFTDWKVSGDKFVADDSHEFGPILWSMYSLSDSRGPDGYVLKMTAQMPPLGAADNDTVGLQLRTGASWRTMATQKIDADARTAIFRITEWNQQADAPFRLLYVQKYTDGSTREFEWTGTVRKEPTGRPFVLGGLTCQNWYAFPYAPVADNLKAMNPDMLFFSGDQLYESHGGFGVIRDQPERAILNYLRKFYMHGWAFGEVMRDRPTLCIPDDHDVFHGNLWGEGGAKMPKGGGTSTSGGYIQPIRMVQVVHKTNCGHHPKLFDPTPVKQGMSVYYGDMVYGRISFAIVGDRQFKSAPGRVATWGGRADHVRDKNLDVKTLDKPGLVLLGERQEKFLEHWATDWRGADMKMLLSETLFNNAATHHGGPNSYLVADLDSNGWPQTPRDRALRIIRKGFPLHINGDQHLATIVHYGVDAQRDSGWSFCTPAIAVGYPRWWRPDEIGRPHKNRPGHGLANTGEYLDGFGNPVYVYSVGNPLGGKAANRYQTAHNKASGFGIIRADTAKRTYTCEAYMFSVDATDGKADNQFPGWPVTIKQADNYARKRTAWLPPLEIKGVSNAVVCVIDEKTGETVYALRIGGDEFQPWVFGEGTYTIKVGEPDKDRWETVKGVKASKSKKLKTVVVDVK